MFRLNKMKENINQFLCKLLNCLQCTQTVNLTTSTIFKIRKPITSNLQAGVDFRDALVYLHRIDMHFVLNISYM